MEHPVPLQHQVIEKLYHEALALSEEVRAGFDLNDMEDGAATPDDPYRVARSCEALRAVTRMMHAVAWLLNHRAYLRGELSEFQLRRIGPLSQLPQRDETRIARLPEAMRALVLTTEVFYRRLLRLEAEWNGASEVASPVGALQDRLRETLSKAS